MASAPLLARAANGLRTKYPLCEQCHSAGTTPSICFRQLPIRLRGQANSLAIITMLHLVNNSRPSQWHSHAQHAIFETVNRFTTSQQAIDETTNFNYSLRVIQLYSGTAATTTVPSDWLHNICHSFGMHSVAMGKLIATHTLRQLFTKFLSKRRETSSTHSNSNSESSSIRLWIDIVQ